MFLRLLQGSDSWVQTRQETWKGEVSVKHGGEDLGEAYGVARFETSFVICSIVSSVSAFPGQQQVGQTYDIDTPIPRDRNHGVERTQINPHYTHCADVFPSNK